MTDYERGVEQASDIFQERNTDDQYELRELIKDAPKFEHMDRSELVAHAYGLYAAGNKVQAENERLRGVEANNIALTSINDRLRDLARDMHRWMGRAVYDGSVRELEYRDFGLALRELGIDADDEDGYEVEDD